jgi:hypothetical protein
VRERREEGGGESGSTVVKRAVDSWSYPKEGKRSDLWNIPFEILYTLGLPVYCPKSGTSRESLEPPRYLHGCLS